MKQRRRDSEPGVPLLTGECRGVSPSLMVVQHDPLQAVTAPLQLPVLQAECFRVHRTRPQHVPSRAQRKASEVHCQPRPCGASRRLSQLIVLSGESQAADSFIGFLSSHRGGGSQCKPLRWTGRRTSNAPCCCSRCGWQPPPPCRPWPGCGTRGGAAPARRCRANRGLRSRPHLASRRTRVSRTCALWRHDPGTHQSISQSVNQSESHAAGRHAIKQAVKQAGSQAGRQASQLATTLCYAVLCCIRVECCAVLCCAVVE